MRALERYSFSEEQNHSSMIFFLGLDVGLAIWCFSPDQLEGVSRRREDSWHPLRSRNGFLVQPLTLHSFDDMEGEDRAFYLPLLSLPAKSSFDSPTGYQPEPYHGIFWPLFIDVLWDLKGRPISDARK